MKEYVVTVRARLSIDAESGEYAEAIVTSGYFDRSDVLTIEVEEVMELPQDDEQ